MTYKVCINLKKNQNSTPKNNFTQKVVKSLNKFKKKIDFLQIIFSKHLWEHQGLSK